MSEVNHWRRVVLWWLLASVIMTPIVVFLLGPGLPPGNGTVESSGQVVDNTVLLAVSTPVALAVIVYFVYAIVAFRERSPESVVDGPPIRGQAHIQIWWLIVTTGIVLFLAGYGTDQAARRRRGRRPGPQPDRRARRREPRAQGPGNRSAVEVHLPVACLRRHRDAGDRAADQHDRPVQRHLA